MREPDLTYLFWESTLRCNLHCAHCGSSCEPSSPLRELSTVEICGILDTIAQDFDPRRIFISITGGEPLLRDDLEAVVAHMSRLGLLSCIVSNGTLITRDRAKQLRDAGLRTVCVSIDGLCAEHDDVRGRGSYDRAMRGVAVAREAGFADVEAITCVRDANLASLPEIETAVRYAGANLWRLITVDKMGRLAGTEQTPLWLGPRGVRRTLDFVAQRRAELQKAGDPFSVQFSCGGFLGVRREGVVRSEHNQCSAGLHSASILCDGSVAACPSLPRSWLQGSALQERFSAIWQREFRRHRDYGWRRTGPCEHCDWFSLCLGGGLHERLAQPDDHCWLLRQSDEPAAR